MFQGKIAFGVLDVRKKEDWNQVWGQAETFFGGQVQVSLPVNLKFENPFFNIFEIFVYVHYETVVCSGRKLHFVFLGYCICI